MTTNDCPSWCVGDHGPLVDEAGLSASGSYDFVHSTDPNPFPVIAMSRLRDGTAVVEGETLDVVLFQHPFISNESGSLGPSEEWVFIGSDSNAMTLTRESATRLYRALGTVLTL